MYMVRFIMADGTQDQEYLYHQKEDAEYHIGLFSNDDADMYFAIQLLCKGKIVVNRILGFSVEEMRTILTDGCRDQIDICDALRQKEHDAYCDQEAEQLILLRLKIERLSYDSFGRFIQIMTEELQR